MANRKSGSTLEFAWAAHGPGKSRAIAVVCAGGAGAAWAGRSAPLA